MLGRTVAVCTVCGWQQDTRPIQQMWH